MPADEALAVLYRAEHTSLVRLAALLLGEVDAAEEVVHDAFVRLHLSWGRLRDPAAAPAWLRSAVLNGARSRLRHVAVRRRHALVRRVVAVGPPADVAAVAAEEHDRLVEALRSLPVRQRETLVLRYWLDLSEAAMAEAMGISTGSVKTHLHRGLAALRSSLGAPEEEEEEEA